MIFIVVGMDHVCYGGDHDYIKEKSFLKHVLKQDDYDLSKFIFTGRLESLQLAKLLSISDLHIYLTVPFVLSWSLIAAANNQVKGFWVDELIQMQLKPASIFLKPRALKQLLHNCLQ